MTSSSNCTHLNSDLTACLLIFLKLMLLILILNPKKVIGLILIIFNNQITANYCGTSHVITNVLDKEGALKNIINQQLFYKFEAICSSI